MRPSSAIAGACRRGCPLGDVVETGAAIEGVAMASAGSGDAYRALSLLASLEALYESLGLRTSLPFWDELLDKYIGAAREALGAEADTAWAEGRTMTLDDAVGVALVRRSK